MTSDNYFVEDNEIKYYICNTSKFLIRFRFDTHVKIGENQTNKEVKKYDFYNPNNILILDENTNYKEIEDFVSKSKYQEIDQKTYKKYSINYWIKEVLSLNY